MKEYRTEAKDERFILVLQRLKEIAAAPFPLPELEDFFRKTADFLLRVEERSRESERNSRENDLLADLEEGSYEYSYADPEYAVDKLGGMIGRHLSFLYYEMKSLAGFSEEVLCSETGAAERLIRMELFVEVYTAFVYDWEEGKVLPERNALRQIFYWFLWDYAEMAAGNCLEERIDPGCTSILYRDWTFVYDTEASAVMCDAGILGPEPGRISRKCIDDHAEDLALVLDRALAGRLLEALHSALEEYGKGGRQAPARIPAGHPLIHFDEGQRQLWEKYCRKREELYREYFPGTFPREHFGNF